jgi:hypothetical protein
MVRLIGCHISGLCVHWKDSSPSAMPVVVLVCVPLSALTYPTVGLCLHYKCMCHNRIGGQGRRIPNIHIIPHEYSKP